MGVLLRRRAYLEVLNEQPRDKPSLVEALGASRSTADRAVDELTDLGLVERRGNEHRLTVPGRQALAAQRRHASVVGDISAAVGVTAAMPADSPLDPAMLTGAEVRGPSPLLPDRPLREALDGLDGVSHLRALVPVAFSAGLAFIEEQVVDGDLDAEFVVAADAIATVAESYPRRFDGIGRAADLHVHATEDLPPFGLWVAEADGRSEAGVVVHSSTGVRGTIQSAAPEAVAWAEGLYADYRETASPQRTPDSDPETAQAEAGTE